MASDQPPAVREAAERLVYVCGQGGVLEDLECQRGELHDNAELVANDWLRLSAEVARLTDYIKSLETTAAQWLNTNQKEIARLRGLNAELTGTVADLIGSGEMMAADLAGHAYGLREKYEFGPECVWPWWRAVEAAKAVANRVGDAVAGRAAG